LLHLLWLLPSLFSLCALFVWFFALLPFVFIHCYFRFAHCIIIVLSMSIAHMVVIVLFVLNELIVLSVWLWLMCSLCSLCSLC
jgi:hypothetical protein